MFDGVGRAAVRLPDRPDGGATHAPGSHPGCAYPQRYIPSMASAASRLSPASPAKTIG